MGQNFSKDTSKFCAYARTAFVMLELWRNKYDFHQMLMYVFFPSLLCLWILHQFVFICLIFTSMHYHRIKSLGDIGNDFPRMSFVSSKIDIYTHSNPLKQVIKTYVLTNVFANKS